MKATWLQVVVIPHFSSKTELGVPDSALWAALCGTPHQGFKPFPLTPKGPKKHFTQLAISFLPRGCRIMSTPLPAVSLSQCKCQGFASPSKCVLQAPNCWRGSLQIDKFHTHGSNDGSSKRDKMLNAGRHHIRRWNSTSAYFSIFTQAGTECKPYVPLPSNPPFHGLTSVNSEHWFTRIISWTMPKLSLRKHVVRYLLPFCPISM